MSLNHHWLGFIPLPYRLLLFTILYTPLSFALPNDNVQKLRIVADAATYNYKNGTNVFQGNVHVDQGSTHIIADKLITSSTNHQLQEAIAYGIKQQAHYWTTPKEHEEPIHAKAMIIKFYPKQASVILQDNVYVKQGKNSFQGQLIHYNNNDQTIIVPPSKNGRAVIVYHPDA